MISVTGKPLSALVEEMYARYGKCAMAEHDWALTAEKRAEIDQAVMRDGRLPDFGRPVKRVSRMDGCKVYFEDAWIILRFSGTEPRVRIFAEAPDIGEAETLVAVLRDALGLA